MEKISFTSKVLHRLGSLGGQSPAQVGMPPDFYFENGDREKDRNADVRSQKWLRKTLCVSIFGFLHTKVRGSKSSVLVTLLSLGVTTVGLGAVQKEAEGWKQHVQEAQNQEKQDQANAMVKAITDLGPADHDHCASHMDDFNGLGAGADANKWSADDKAMGAFRDQCVNAQAISGVSGKYNLRKFDSKAFATLSAQACAAHLADSNALAKQAGWQTNMDADAMALRTFTLKCTNAGFLQANGGNPLADGVVFSLRKYNPSDLMFASAEKCHAALADMNAVVGKPGWRNAKTDDDRALASFSNMCVINGFLKAMPSANDTETLTEK